MSSGLTAAHIEKLSASGLEWDVSQIEYGEVGHKIIVIDNFSPDADRLVEHSRTLSFGPRSPHYPGVQAPAPPASLKPLFPAIGFLIANGFDQPGTMGLEACNYSYVTTPPDRLSAFQRYPHYDGGSDRKMALLHYLCGPEHGGTRFFRHDRTGWEHVTRDRDAAYADARQADIAEYGLKPDGYTRESGEGFTLLHSVPAKFNRAVLYSSTVLHSGDLGDSPTFDATPETGRLTVNTFVSPA